MGNQIQVLYLYFLVTGPLTLTYQCIRLLTKSIIQIDSKSINCLSDDQKHISVINPEYSSFLSNKCGNGKVSEVGAFFVASPNILIK